MGYRFTRSCWNVSPSNAMLMSTNSPASFLFSSTVVLAVFLGSCSSLQATRCDLEAFHFALLLAQLGMTATKALTMAALRDPLTRQWTDALPAS
jgi:membrane glycosyltransferase